MRRKYGKKMRAIPRHLNIDKKKTLDVQPDPQNFFYETINKAKKGKTKLQTKCQNFYLCSYENVWDSEKENITKLGVLKNMTIANDIMNYI